MIITKGYGSKSIITQGYGYTLIKKVLRLVFDSAPLSTATVNLQMKTSKITITLLK